MGERLGFFSRSARRKKEAEIKDGSAKVYRAFLSGLWRELEGRMGEDRRGENKDVSSFSIPFISSAYPDFLMTMLQKCWVDPKDDSSFIYIERDQGFKHTFELGLVTLGMGKVIFENRPDAPEEENLVCRASSEKVAEDFNNRPFSVRADRIQKLVKAVKDSIKDGALEVDNCAVPQELSGRPVSGQA